MTREFILAILAISLLFTIQACDLFRRSAVSPAGTGFLIISVLAQLTQLGRLDLAGNRITEIGALVLNQGLGRKTS